MKTRLASIARKRPALAFAMPVLAALGLLVFSQHAREAARLQRDAARAAVADASADLSAAEDLLQRNQGLQTRLARLREQGLDQPIDEFRWHEALGKARQDLHLRALHYELAPARPVAHTAETSSLRTVTLRVDALLRHEEDFLALIRRLEQVGSGVMTRRCRLSLKQEEDIPPRLDTRCEFERPHIWLGREAIGHEDTLGAAPSPSTGAARGQDQER